MTVAIYTYRYIYWTHCSTDQAYMYLNMSHKLNCCRYTGTLKGSCSCLNQHWKIGRYMYIKNVFYFVLKFPMKYVKNDMLYILLMVLSELTLNNWQLLQLLQRAFVFFAFCAYCYILCADEICSNNIRMKI